MPYPEVFVGLQSPLGPLSRACIYKVMSLRFLSLGIEVLHHGPHVLRHNIDATRTCAKVNLVALREVGDFDLGELCETYSCYRSLYCLAVVARLAFKDREADATAIQT
jgi:hypothetical protein